MIRTVIPTISESASYNFKTTSHSHTKTEKQKHTPMYIHHIRTHTHSHTQKQTNKQTEDTPCLSLDVKRGQSLINLISLDILLIMKYGLFVTRSNSQISSRGRRFDSSVGCLNPCTCSCSTDKVLSNIEKTG